MAWIHNNVILPLAERSRHQGLGRRLKQLRNFEIAAPEQQRLMQAAALSELLRHAYDSTPYYRRLFDEAGFHPSEWKAGDPLPFPTLNRDMLRAHEEDLRSRRHAVEDMHAAATGGTTSTPVRLWRDTEALRKKTALNYHLNQLAGYDQGDSILMLWGAERDIELNPGWRWRLYEQGLMSRYICGAGQIGENLFAHCFDMLQKKQPRVLYGYGGTLARFAEYVLVKKLNAHRPAVVIITAEAVSDLELDFIERAFGCRPTDQYGSRDVGMIAMECACHTGLHFHPAGCFVEFEYAGMTPDGPMHRLIVTDLMNYGMPMIRYQTEDCLLLDPEPCACGKWYPKAKKILGRSGDNLLLPDRTEVPSVSIAVRMAMMKHPLKHITQVQIIQPNLDSLIVRYVAIGEEEEIESEIVRLKALLLEITQAPTDVKFVRIPEIFRERSGKLRLCISEVSRASLAANL